MSGNSSGLSSPSEPLVLDVNLASTEVALSSSSATDDHGGQTTAIIEESHVTSSEVPHASSSVAVDSDFIAADTNSRHE